LRNVINNVIRKRVAMSTRPLEDPHLQEDAAETPYPVAWGRRSTVLVAVVNNMDDLRRAASEGWYRIPQRRAPRRIGADYLAFYQTGAFRGQEEAQTVSYYAATRRYRLLTRQALLPAEADHPRAEDFYFCIDLGPLQRLEKPLPSLSLRRITFIHTTLDRLLHAQDVKDLFVKEEPFDRLWQALRDNRLRPLPNRLVDQHPVDITLRARGGYLGIRCGEAAAEPATRESTPVARQERWELLCLPPAQVEHDLDGCLRQIGSALIRLGGSVLNQDHVRSS
jgi:hypothetical protein